MVGQPGVIPRPLTRRVVPTSRPTASRPTGRRHPPAPVLPRPTTVVAAIGAAAAVPSWYLAKFVATAGQQGSDERRTSRWGLRGLNRQEGVSALKRPAQCGTPIGNNPVKVKQRGDGGGHVAGVETCASVWACPVCAATIRNHRAEEITAGMMELLRRPTKAERLAGHKASGMPAEQRKDVAAVAAYVRARREAFDQRELDLEQRAAAAGKRFRPTRQPFLLSAVKGGALLVTLTLPHQAADALDRTVELVSEGFRALQQDRAYRQEREDHGILGHIRAFEVTHGQNGWHPHLHVLLVLESPATEDEAALLQDAWLGRWNAWLARQGWPPASAAHGVRVDRVKRDAQAVAAYVAKLQEGDKPRKTNVAVEVTRSDLKRAAQGSRVPFQILADFGTDGAGGDLDLWHEYQTGTQGRSAIRWSVGLRALLLPDVEELTDEEIVSEDKGGDLVALLAAPLYRAIQRRPYADAYLQVAAEQGGLDGIKRFVRCLGLSDAGVHPPEALKYWQEIEEYRKELSERD